MAFAGTGKIWMNGSLVEWKDAKVHVGSHVIHYARAVVNDVRSDVDLRVLPLDQRAVHPDLAGSRESHVRSSDRILLCFAAEPTPIGPGVEPLAALPAEPR